jgi:hypothetical protein
MIKYFVGIDAIEVEDAILYDDIKEAKEYLDNLEDTRLKIYKVTVEECPQN